MAGEKGPDRVTLTESCLVCHTEEAPLCIDDALMKRQWVHSHAQLCDMVDISVLGMVLSLLDGQ